MEYDILLNVFSECHCADCHGALSPSNTKVLKHSDAATSYPKQTSLSSFYYICVCVKFPNEALLYMLVCHLCKAGHCKS